jgi:hypothetical protein
LCEKIFVIRFSTRDVVKRGARNRFCYTAPQWPHADLQIVAWIHPLNLASAVLSFKLQVFGRVGQSRRWILALASPSSRLSLRSTRIRGLRR